MKKKLSKLRISSRLLKKRMRRKGTLGVVRHCMFCAGDEKAHSLNYKNANLLRGFLTERGKILPSRISGVCSGHQRQLSTEIKKARVMALIPYLASQF